MSLNSYDAMLYAAIKLFNKNSIDFTSVWRIGVLYVSLPRIMIFWDNVCFCVLKHFPQQIDARYKPNTCRMVLPTFCYLNMIVCFLIIALQLDAVL